MKFAGREEFLAAIRYRDVDCPDAGTVSVFDYISAGAMGAFAAHQANPDEALSAVIKSSLDDSDKTFPKLSMNDYAAIARHLVRVTGVEAVFDENFQTSGLAAAFVHAIEQSTDWQSHRKSEERMRAAFEKSFRPFNSVFREIERQRSSILEIGRHAEFMGQFNRGVLSALRTPLMELKSFESIALSSARALQDINRLHENSRAHLERWDRLNKDLVSRAELAPSFVKHQKDLALMVDRVNLIKPLVEPIAGLSSTFADIASQLRARPPLPDSLLAIANSSLAASRLSTLKTNDFFAQAERPSAIAWSESVLPRQAIEQEEEIRSAYEKGETILHEETALIIAEGTSIVEHIRQVIGDEIDQRLGKYGSILSRLENLSKPPVFREFLQEFSIIAAREYWGSLWIDPGTKWQTRPERHAQAMLGMYLHGKWSGIAFVGREIANGDGFVDLLVNFMGRDYIVELKMVGAGWAVSHADSGLQQIAQYMANYQSQEAYLVVFDGRKTDRGRQLPEKHENEHGIVHVVVVPSYFDAPSAS